eukprot:197725_1
MCIVNPTNPTGDYWNVNEIKEYIERNCELETTVIVDESMQPWLGPHWRQDSLISQREWARRMSLESNIHVWVMTSWTKIWSCTGVRLGSVVAPTLSLAEALKSKQVPWSVNCIALDFLSACCKDEEYLKKTWELTRIWNREMREDFASQHPTWDVHGTDFLSWLWVDTHDENVCRNVVARAKAAGVPVRSGAPGYNMPTFFRAAVRPRDKSCILMEALASL